MTVLVLGHPVRAEEPAGPDQLAPAPSARQYRSAVGKVALPTRNRGFAPGHHFPHRSVASMRVAVLETRRQAVHRARITVVVHARLAFELEGRMRDGKAFGDQPLEPI